MTRTLCVLAIAALLAGGCTERQSAPPPAVDAPAVDTLLDQVDEQLAEDAQPTEEDD